MMNNLLAPIAQSGGDTGGTLVGFLIISTVGLIFGAIGCLMIWRAYQSADLRYDFRRQSKTTVADLSDGSIAKVNGTVRKKDTTTSAPLNNVDDAVLFHYELEKYEESADDQAGGHWETVDQEKQNVGFLIEDETGNEILVPEDASPDIYTTDEKRTRKRAAKTVDFRLDTLNIDVSIGQRMRHTQKAFCPGDDIIVYGTAHKSTHSRSQAPSYKVTDGSAVDHFAVTDKQSGLPSYLKTIALAVFGLLFAGVGLLLAALSLSLLL